jgi:hypothetical protein
MAGNRPRKRFQMSIENAEGFGKAGILTIALPQCFNLQKIVRAVYHEKAPRTTVLLLP